MKRIGPGRYQVPSNTAPGRFYSVQVNGDRGTCNCLGAYGAERAGRNCKHARAAIAAEKEYEMSNNGQDSQAVAVRDNAPGALAVAPPPTTLPSKSEFAVMMAIAENVVQTSGKLIPAEIKTSGEALAIMLAGHELGIPPMAAFREIYIVKGRTSPSYRVIAGLVLNGDPGARLEWRCAPGCEAHADKEHLERSATRANVRLTRSNGMSIEVEYTWKMAQDAQLTGSDFYKKYPVDALAKMALTRACRLAGADLITGIGASTKHAPAVMEAFEDDDDPLPTMKQVRVVDAPKQSSDHEAEQTAHNQTRTAAPTPAVTPDKQRILAAVKRAKAEWGDEFKPWYEKLSAMYPKVFLATGAYKPQELSDDDAAKLAEAIEQNVGHGPPAAEAEAEAEQGELVV